MSFVDRHRRLADRCLPETPARRGSRARAGVIREAALGLGRMSILAGLATVVVLCGDQAIACELAQRPKPVIKAAQPGRDLLAHLQKRLDDLLRPATPSSTPSRRFILQ
ncbi:hypothetical protein HRJ34_26390 [Rhizorhabdus wittichii]|uniref:Uncharacterized protein n=2 Tax=Rhizorhabdus wittichii TaxID=160791 RepID=A0A975HDU3_9SPHN|nr:hypothetical protein HRJ34_26390 [Rhizorhabdus wittichii]